MRNNPQNVGKVQTFMVANGLSELRQGGEDVSPYSCFDSEMGIDFDSDEFSNLRGRRRAKKVKTKTRRLGGKIMDSSTVKNMQKNIASRRDKKLAIKNKEADIQAKIADATLKDAASNTALLQQISATVPAAPADEKKPMNKTLKIGLIVGGAIALVVTGVILYKKFKSKSK